MKVYKFGGASVRNADGVQNLLKIIGDERDLFIIVSAMGKTTNALEKVFEGLQKGDKAFSMEHITALRQYHAEIVNELYGAPTRLEKAERRGDQILHDDRQRQQKKMLVKALGLVKIGEHKNL